MVVNSAQSPAPIPLEFLRERQSTLEQRLEDGFRRIDEAERQGRDVTAWESFWLQLLAEYESVSDVLATAA